LLRQVQTKDEKRVLRRSAEEKAVNAKHDLQIGGVTPPLFVVYRSMKAQLCWLHRVCPVI